MSRLFRVAYLLVVLIVFGSHSVSAADLAPQSVVRIIIAGGSATKTNLLTARLARAWQTLQATIITEVTPEMDVSDVLAPNTRGDKARVWIDLSDPQAATIFVTEAENVFERRIKFEQGFDNVALELLDVVTTSAVQSVLAGEHLGVTREEFSHSLPAPPARAALEPAGVTPYEPGVTASVGFTYQGAMLASDKLTHGPGLEGQLQWTKLRLEVELRGGFSYEVGDAGETLSLTPVGLRLGAGRVFSIAPSLDCVLSLAGGIDVTRVQPSSNDSNLAASSALWSVTPVLSPQVRLEYPMKKVRVAGLIGADLDFWATSYVVSASQGPVAIWSPWRIRPVAGAAVSYAF